MTIDESTVRKIAKLGKIKFSEDEISSYAQQFEEILKYVDKLEELDTEDIKPLSHVHDLKNVFREDQAQTSDDRDKFLDNAPDKKGPYFKVPKVIGDEE